MHETKSSPSLNGSEPDAGSIHEPIGGHIGAGFHGAAEMTRRHARMVLGTMREVRPKVSVHVKADAARILADRGPSGADGSLGQVKGKMFEHLDAERFNKTAANLRRGRKLVLATDPQSRIDGLITNASGGTKAVSHKLSAHGVRSAARETPTRVCFRTPCDQAAKTTGRLADRITPSKVSSSTVDSVTEKGLRRLRSSGATGTSVGVAAAKAGVTGAAMNMAFKGYGDYRSSVRHGTMTWSEFSFKRAVDGVEGGVIGIAGYGGSATAAWAIAGTVLASGPVLPVAIPLAVSLGLSIGVSKLTGHARTTLVRSAPERDAAAGVAEDYTELSEPEPEPGGPGTDPGAFDGYRSAA